MLQWNLSACLRASALIIAVAAIAACSGRQTPGPNPTQPTGTTIGAAGGTATGPSGAKVVVPAGALSSNAVITIEQSSVGAPPQASVLTVFGSMFAFTPHGTSFALPVTVTLPFNPALVPTGKEPVLYKTNAQNQWEQVDGAVFGTDTVTAQFTSFSWVQVGGLLRDSPFREWTFGVYPGDGRPLTPLPPPNDGGAQIGGEVVHLVPFGVAFDDLGLVDEEVGETLPPDGIANGSVYSSANGVTYALGAEAPYGRVGNENPIGSKTLFKQTQSYIKLVENAKLSFTVTDVYIEGQDFNGPADRGDSLIHGEVLLVVGAYKTAEDYFYYTAGKAFIVGHDTFWIPGARDESFSRAPLWDLIEDFDFTSRDVSYTVGGIGAQGSCLGRKATLRLKKPKTYSVDLSSVDVGEEFTLKVYTHTYANNRRGGGSIEDCQASSLATYLRDPIDVGSATITMTGLEPTNRPLPSPPDALLVAPAACTPGPGPNAESGVLQFEAANFTMEEFADAASTVIVTRTGGSVGAVSATVRTSDGTAVSGQDYVPVNSTVFFADGDSAPRSVNVSTIPNLVVAPDKTINLALSQPGGCAALGSQTNSILTIRDDLGIGAPPPPSRTIGGTVTGLQGTGLVLRNIGSNDLTPGNGAFTFPIPTPSGLTYSVTVATQPSNPSQICTVTNGSGTVTNADITNVVVNCVTPAATGSLDASFGSLGKVNTGFGGDETAMALQADGKIVMAGGSGSNFSLARYNVDGSLDVGFGVGGLVTTDLGSSSNEAAHGVAIQADGKIVVVGFTVVGRTPRNLFNLDFAVVRYNADGSLDPSFGTGGIVTTDFNSVTDRAYAVAIQPDGKIVVVGDAGFDTGNGTSSDFGIARYNADGTLDLSFSGDGKQTTDIVGGVDLARNVILLNANSLLVSGPITEANDAGLDHTGVARYDSSGILDTTFGASGKVMRADVRVGEGMAVQADGKIVLAGSVDIGVFPARASQFALLRLTANGAIDNSFGTSGLVNTPFTAAGDFGRDVTVQADGKILVAGQSSNQSNPDFALARYDSGGALDGSFGSAGKLTVDFFGAFDGAENVRVQPDGKIVVSGFARNGTTTGYGIVRVVQ